MWLFRELRASYAAPGKSFPALKDLDREWFGPSAGSRAVTNRFSRAELQNDDLTLQSFFHIYNSIQLSATIKDRPRALNALNEYGFERFGFDYKSKEDPIILKIFLAVRDHCAISPIAKEKTMSMQELTNRINSVLEKDTKIGENTLEQMVRTTRQMEIDTVEKLIDAMSKIITDGEMKEQLMDDLKEYLKNYAVPKGGVQSTGFHYNREDSLVLIPEVNGYLDQLTEKGKYPSHLLSPEELKKKNRVSSFNNKMTYFDSDQKAKAIREFINQDCVRFYDANSAPNKGKLSFLKVLMTRTDPTKTKYKPNELWKHGLPKHEVMLPRIVDDFDWAIASEIPVFLKPKLSENIKLLSGHIDLIVIVDGVVYICDYKPDQSGDPTITPHESFLNSIPQVAAYAYLFKEQTGLMLKDIKCVTFTDKTAWVFEPENAMQIASDLMVENTIRREKDITPKIIPWMYYFPQFFHQYLP